jgi:putative peptide-modifying radical SAM enzyme
MNWFIITNTDCNLKCIYCQNEPHPVLPIQPDWDINELKEFLSNDDEPIITFYGGEPLLNINLIEQVMEEIQAKHYTLQTNGLLLKRIPSKKLHQFSSILVSLDGNKRITDTNRGRGVYDKVAENIQDIRNRGYKGDLIARMSISMDSDIYNDVIHLMNSEELTFDHVHWQIDCQWDEGWGVRWKDFPSWVEEYNQKISKLVNYWLKEMNNGIVKGFVPFLGIFRHILDNTKTDLPCQAGLTSFAIRTDSEITFCPLPPELDEEAIVGNLRNSSPQSLMNSTKIKNPCPSCDVFNLCGGRCLFANLYKLWGEEGFEVVCKTIKHLVQELRRIEPNVRKLIEMGRIKAEEFEYPTYNNSTEIIA